jgi:hypothetical protein
MQARGPRRRAQRRRRSGGMSLEPRAAPCHPSPALRHITAAHRRAPVPLGAGLGDFSAFHHCLQFTHRANHAPNPMHRLSMHLVERLPSNDRLPSTAGRSSGCGRPPTDIDRGRHRLRPSSAETVTERGGRLAPAPSGHGPSRCFVGRRRLTSDADLGATRQTQRAIAITDVVRVPT